MKSMLFLCVFAASNLGATPVLVKVGPETLARLQMRDPSIRLVTESDESDKSAAPDVLPPAQASTVLHDGKNWTIVPSDAVIVISDALRRKMNVKPVGMLLPWTDFLARNQSWIATHEVTFDQAAGTESLSAAEVAELKKQDKIVIAVRETGPVAVRVVDLPIGLAAR